MQSVTAPYDPRFPNRNQARHCFVRFNEYHKWVFNFSCSHKPSTWDQIELPYHVLVRHNCMRSCGTTLTLNHHNFLPRCVFERGEDHARCQFYQKAYQSLCPADWLESWNELREKGLWTGKYWGRGMQIFRYGLDQAYMNQIKKW